MMKAELRLRPMNEGDVAVIEEWFLDKELKKRFGGVLPFGNYFDYVQNQANYFAVVTSSNDILCGAAFIEVEPTHEASLAFFIKPDRRGKGYGRLLLKELLDRTQQLGIEKVKVGVETDNVASIKCLTSCGFLLESHEADTDGFLHFSYSGR